MPRAGSLYALQDAQETLDEQCDRAEARARLRYRASLKKRLEDPILRARYLHEPLPEGWPSWKLLGTLSTKELEEVVARVVVPYEERQKRIAEGARKRAEERGARVIGIEPHLEFYDAHARN